MVDWHRWAQWDGGYNLIDTDKKIIGMTVDNYKGKQVDFQSEKYLILSEIYH